MKPDKMLKYAAGAVVLLSVMWAIDRGLVGADLFESVVKAALAAIGVST